MMEQIQKKKKYFLKTGSEHIYVIYIILTNKKIDLIKRSIFIIEFKNR